MSFAHQPEKRKPKGAALKPIGIVITDRDGNILYVNEGFTQITKYEEHEVKGKNPRILQSGLHSHLFYKRMWRSLIKNRSWQGVLWDRRKDETIYLEALQIRAISNEKGEVAYYRGEFEELDGIREAITQLIPIPELEERVLLPSLAETNVKEA